MKRCFQHGSLYKQGKRKKVWVGRWREPVVASDGRVRWVRRSEVLGTIAELPTKTEAAGILADRLRPINRDSGRVQPTCTLRCFVDEQWAPEMLPTLKYSTQQNYRYVLDSHVLPMFGETQLRLITRDAVQQFLTAKLAAGLAWKTVQEIRMVFGLILRSAEERDLVAANPIRKTRLPRRPPAPERPALGTEDLQRLLEALPEPSRSLATVVLLTGLRIGEVLALRWQDVDLAAQRLRVTQTVYEGRFDTPKTNRSMRTLPVADEVAAIFARRRKDEATGLVFATRGGAPLSRRNLLSRQLAPAAKTLGLPQIGWHSLRHAHASLLDSVGTPIGTVQALLGHASAELTRRVYLHSVPADARKAVEEVARRLTGPNWTQNVEIPKPVTPVIQ